MDYYKSPIHLFYLLKLLQEQGRLEIIEQISDGVVAGEGEIDYDTVYDAANRVIAEVFDTCEFYYNEDKGVVTCVITDEFIKDYYRLSGEYGKRNGFSDENNPYFLDASKEGGRWLNFSYNLGWFLEHKPKSRSPYKSKLVLLWDEYEEFEMLGVAIGVAGLYGFFRKKCVELASLLSVKEAAAA